MTYLIDPKVFYWMNFAQSVEFFTQLFIAVAILFLAGLGGFYLIQKYESSGKYGVDEAKEMCKLIELKFKPKLTIFILSFMVAISIVIPSQDTMIKMLVASQVTTENIEGVQKSATELIDYIVDKINETDREE